MEILWIILGVVGFLLLVLIVVSLIFFSIGLGRQKRCYIPYSEIDAPSMFFKQCKNKDAIRKIQKFVVENQKKITIKDKKGFILNAYYLETPGANKNFVMFHGWKSYYLVDHLPVIPFLIENKCNVLLVEQRGCGESKTRHVYMGNKEKDDAHLWINHLMTLNNLPTYIYGDSMGAATVYFSLDKPYPDTVKGFVVDSGYISTYGIFKAVINRDYHLPAFPIVDLANLWATIFLGFSFKKNNALKVINNTTKPILFVTGDADSFVPKENTIQAYETYKGEKELLLVKDADHVQSFVVDEESYKEALSRLFKK